MSLCVGQVKEMPAVVAVLKGKGCLFFVLICVCYLLCTVINSFLKRGATKFIEGYFTSKKVENHCSRAWSVSLCTAHLILNASTFEFCTCFAACCLRSAEGSFIA